MRGTPNPVPAGVVEVFDTDRVVGWVETPTPGRTVDLLVNGEVVASTTASTATRRSGSDPVFGFDLALADLWDFVGPPDRLAVRVAGADLPIAGHGTFLVPAAAGEHSAADLHTRLGRGEVFTRDGRLALPQSLDPQWQAAALALYTALRGEVADVLAQDVMLLYGTLLGVVRDGEFIGRDTDLDAGYVSDRRDGPGAATELRRLALTLVDRGYRVRATPVSLRVSRADDPTAQVTLYHLWVDGSATLRFPFGHAGEAPPPGRPDLVERPFHGTQVVVPADADALLRALYGPGWRTPDPGFRWSSARRHRAADGELTAAAVEEVYWADFYARTTFERGSTFFDLVSGRPELPSTVLDLGCGDGRDSFAFAATGTRTVTGLDRSQVGVRQAQRTAESLALGHVLTFAACDVSDVDALREALETGRRGADPVLFYLRFFLHSIPEDVQRTLLQTLAATARPGDALAAEFRTDRDELATKVHGGHYRRFQNGPAFGQTLRRVYGFEPVLEQEGNGLSPYLGEDPYLYRVIGRRP